MKTLVLFMLFSLAACAAEPTKKETAPAAPTTKEAAPPPKPVAPPAPPAFVALGEKDKPPAEINPITGEVKLRPGKDPKKVIAWLFDVARNTGDQLNHCQAELQALKALETKK